MGDNKPGRRETFAILTAGMRLIVLAGARGYPTLGSCFLTLSPFFFMGTPESGPAAPETNAAKTTGKPFLKLRDGTLTVSVFSKQNAKGDPYSVVVPERAYKDREGKWVNTSTLYEGDLLQMSVLLMQTHAKLRTTVECQKEE